MNIIHYDGSSWVIDSFENYMEKHYKVPYDTRKIGTDLILRFLGSNEGLYFTLYGEIDGVEVWDVWGLDKNHDTMWSQANEWMSEEDWLLFDSIK